MIKLLKYMNNWAWGFIVLVIGLVVLQVYCDLELPTKLSNILTSASTAEALIDQGLMTDILQKKYQDEIMKNGLEMFAYAGISLFSSVLVCFFASRIASSFSYNLRKELYQHIQKFSISEIENFSTASLITRTTNDITQIQMVVLARSAFG